MLHSFWDFLKKIIILNFKIYFLLNFHLPFISLDLSRKGQWERDEMTKDPSSSYVLIPLTGVYHRLGGF